jgi:hypothetical protein
MRVPASDRERSFCLPGNRQKTHALTSYTLFKRERVRYASPVLSGVPAWKTFSFCSRAVPKVFL